MVEDGHNLGLVLAVKHLLHKLEAKGLLSYHEVQRMLDEALGEVKRLRIDDEVTPEAAEDAIEILGGLSYRS
jgi:hypothetical protein